MGSWLKIHIVGFEDLEVWVCVDLEMGNPEDFEKRWWCFIFLFVFDFSVFSNGLSMLHLHSLSKVLFSAYMVFLHIFCFQLLSLQTTKDHLQRLTHEISGLFFFPPFNSFFFANFGLSSSNFFSFKRISHFEFMQNPVLFHLFSF